MFLDDHDDIWSDGNYSVKISNEKALWFFSDTWLGEVENNKRKNPVLINNSVGVQVFKDGKSTVQYHWGKTAAGKPSALLVPKDGKGWFWPFAGIMQGEKFVLFLFLMEKADGPSGFAFKNAGVVLVEIDNPNDAPNSWRIQQIKVPHVSIGEKRKVLFGSAICVAKDFTYIYGYEENKGGFYKKMLLARCSNNQVAKFTDWEFYDGSGWSKNLEDAKPLMEGVASEYSVNYVPGLKRFLLVYHDAFLSPDIVGRTSLNPWGPWSEKIKLHTCEEKSWSNEVFCYSGKVQPWLSKENEIIISYAANAKSLAGVINDARLYWPTFIRVKINAAP
ncbi:MAG: DUF4185 domain-containing protein [Planctomycetia bacterium]|nr:DUF4185 domain-containing protein [Planctomycetia bacterium]